VSGVEQDDLMLKIVATMPDFHPCGWACN
jgi:hypothetical protein